MPAVGGRMVAPGSLVTASGWVRSDTSGSVWPSARPIPGNKDAEADAEFVWAPVASWISGCSGEVSGWAICAGIWRSAGLVSTRLCPVCEAENTAAESVVSTGLSAWGRIAQSGFVTRGSSKALLTADPAFLLFLYPFAKISPGIC